MAVMEISVVPIGTSSASVSEYVADCVRVLEEKGVVYEVTPMGTQVEGEPGRLLEMALQMHEVPFRKGALRVLTTIRIDDRRDKPLTLRGKREAVKRHLEKR